MKNALKLSLAFVLICGCQKSAERESVPPPVNQANDTPVVRKGKLGPVENVSQLHFANSLQFMAGPANLIQGAWVSQCYPATVRPHIACNLQLPFYRMFYLLYPVDKSGNMLAQHFVKEYNDPLCSDNFSGPFDPNTRKSIEVVGYYRIRDESKLFQNVLQISFEWTQCSGACQASQNPVNGVYLNQVKVAALRESEDQRQVLFWGDQIQARFPSPNPFIPDQIFNWNVPFYRLDF